jgi:hypothetical protein
VPKLAILTTTNVFVFGKISSLGDQKKKAVQIRILLEKIGLLKLNVILGLHKFT